MRVPHYAKQPLAAMALALAALTAGCGGGDSNGPSAPFDPEGTSSDIAALDASFDSPAASGFAAASGAISTVLGESSAAVAVKAMPTKALIRGDKASAGAYAATVAQAYLRTDGGMRPSPASAAILDEHLGVTFVYNTDTDQYEASDLDGAPANGARFIVYAVNGITGQIIEPLVEVGYADIFVTETSSAATVRIELVSGGVTYLDYSVGFTYSSTAATLTVSGFITNGDDRVDFDLDIHGDDESLTLDFVITVPTRGGFRIDLELELTAATETVTSELEARGPHGTVAITGTANGTSGSYEVEVNGELFATITVSQGQQVIAGADGEPLTNEELEALGAVFGVFEGSFEFMSDLVVPIGGPAI